MIVHKLKNVLQNKPVVFFIISYSIRSVKKLKNIFEEVHFLVSCLLELSNFAKMNPFISFLTIGVERLVFFSSRTLAEQNLSYREYFLLAAPYTFK